MCTCVSQCPGSVLGESRMSVGVEENSSPPLTDMCASRVGGVFLRAQRGATRTRLLRSVPQSERAFCLTSESLRGTTHTAQCGSNATWSRTRASTRGSAENEK